MSFCNNYTSPSPPHRRLNDLYGPDPYDINCIIPLNLAVLENERIKLTPIIPRIHATEFLEQVQKHPEIHHYIPFPFPNTLDDVCEFFREFQKIPGHILFAIHDKTRPSDKFEQAVGGGGCFAGTIALVNTSIPDLSTEVGFIVFQDYQRTHVFSNAAGLLINYCLNLPSDPISPGFGFRRVQWFANSANLRSIAAGERLGFRQEATLRWHRVLPGGKDGIKSRDGDPAGEDRFGRHSVLLSLCWDDWDGGAKERLAIIMART